MTSGFHHEIVFCATSFGHEVVGDVRDGVEQFAAFVLCRFHCLFFDFAAFFNVSHLLLSLFCFFLLSLLHEHADALGSGIDLSVEVVETCLCFLAFVVNGEHLLNHLFRVFEVFFLESVDDGFFIVDDLFDGKHSDSIC